MWTYAFWLGVWGNLVASFIGWLLALLAFKVTRKIAKVDTLLLLIRKVLVCFGLLALLFLLLFFEIMPFVLAAVLVILVFAACYSYLVAAMLTRVHRSENKPEPTGRYFFYHGLPLALAVGLTTGMFLRQHYEHRRDTPPTTAPTTIVAPRV